MELRSLGQALGEVAFARATPVAIAATLVLATFAVPQDAQAQEGDANSRPAEATPSNESLPQGPPGAHESSPSAPTPSNEPLPQGAPADNPPPPSLSPPTGTTPEPSESQGHNPNRSVGPHQFQFPILIDSAFVATFVGVQARVATFDLPNLPTQFGNIDVSAVHLSEGLDAAFRITDYLGIFATAGMRTFAGTNVKSFVYDGVAFNYGGDAGAILRAYRNDRSGTQVSVRGSGGLSKGQISSLVELFSAAGGDASLADAVNSKLLLTPVHKAHFDGTVAVAQALSPMFGLQASLALGWATTTAEPFDAANGIRIELRQRGVTYHAGLAASCDFMALRVPIALMVEYRHARQTSTPGALRTGALSNVNELYAGVYYSGRPNLQLGLGAGAAYGLAPGISNQGRSDRGSLSFGQFILRYVW